jgi:hypothetical protein
MKAQLRNVEELREFACRVHGGDCLAQVPVSINTKVLWKCKNLAHKPFPATPAHVMVQRKPTWCPECDGERRRLNPPKPQVPFEIVEHLVASRGGRVERIFGNGVWSGLHTRIEVSCADGHKWPVTGDNLVHAGSWCPECQNKGELIARAIFEATFGAKFPKSKPAWLFAETGHRLELDGYCESLRLAFEYQGPHHFHRDDTKTTDALKRGACARHGVQLVEIEAVKRPFPVKNVLAKVTLALQSYGLGVTPILPAIDIFARALNLLRGLATEKGGSLFSTTYLGSEPHEWWCGSSEHAPFWAEPWRVRKGSWCPSCAGNRSLGIHGLRAWGNSVGLDLIDGDYAGTGAEYKWRCQAAGHVISRTKGNIQQSLDKSYPACDLCGPGINANVRARQDRADTFAAKTITIIEALRAEGFISLESIAKELNARGIQTVRDARWYPSAVKNVIGRASRPDG